MNKQTIQIIVILLSAGLLNFLLNIAVAACAEYHIDLMKPMIFGFLVYVLASMVMTKFVVPGLLALGAVGGDIIYQVISHMSNSSVSSK